MNNGILLKSFLLGLCASAILATGCRIKPMDAEKYTASSGNLSPAEARMLISNQFRKNGIKCAYNVKLNLKGVKIDADGFDYNLKIGFIYLLKSAEGIEGKSIPAGEKAEALANIERREQLYIAFINEGNEEQVSAQTESFIAKLYKTGVIFKTPLYMGPDDAGFEDDAGIPADGSTQIDSGTLSTGPAISPDAGR